MESELPTLAAQKRTDAGRIVNVSFGTWTAVLVICVIGWLVSLVDLAAGTAPDVVESMFSSPWLKGMITALIALFIIFGVFGYYVAFRREAFSDDFWRLLPPEAHQHPHLCGITAIWTSVCWLAFLFACEFGALLPPSPASYVVFVVLLVLTCAPIVAIKRSLRARRL
jgi:hypothetical protein